VNHAAPMPEAIDLRAGSLRLTWAGGASSSLPTARLRAACRCGGCRAEALRGRPPVPEAGLALTGASPVGQYALQLLFSDGHDRGIYPWDLLRGLAGEETASGEEDTGTPPGP
jgi:DUF971 family protein